jgi:hypothetical protein
MQDHDIEHEGVDVKNTSLPGLQESFALQVGIHSFSRLLLLLLSPWIPINRGHCAMMVGAGQRKAYRPGDCRR